MAISGTAAFSPVGTGWASRWSGSSVNLLDVGIGRLFVYNLLLMHWAAKTDAMAILHILREEKQGSYEVLSRGLGVVTNIRQHGTFKPTGWVPKAIQER